MCIHTHYIFIFGYNKLMRMCQMAKYLLLVVNNLVIECQWNLFEKLL